MLTKKRKRQLSLRIIVLYIALGFVLFFLFNFSSFMDVSNYRIVDNFTVDYIQGFGGANVDFRISYRSQASFDSTIILQTISSEDIEEIGITEFSYDVFRDEDHIRYNEWNFATPATYRFDSFTINDISIHNEISCIGTIEAQFSVEGIVRNETITFELSIIIPVNPYEIRSTHLYNSIWVAFGLGAGLLILLGLIARTVLTWKREATYSEKAKKRDQEFFDYIGDKLKEIKKESS